MISQQYQKGFYALSATLLAYGTNRVAIEYLLQNNVGIDPDETNLDETMSMVSAMCGGLIATIAEDVDYASPLTFAPLAGALSFTWLVSGLTLSYIKYNLGKEEFPLTSHELIDQVEDFMNKSALGAGVIAGITALIINRSRLAHMSISPTTPDQEYYRELWKQGLYNTRGSLTETSHYGLPSPIKRHY